MTVVCCLLFVVCCLLFVVCCLLFVVLLLFFLVGERTFDDLLVFFLVSVKPPTSRNQRIAVVNHKLVPLRLSFKSNHL